MSQTAIYALTPQGARLGRILADKLGGDLFLPARLAATHGAISFGRLLDVVADNFYLFPAHVFITATGIAVRAIAPHLVSKDRDPAVIVLDQEGRHAISLLSGHLGGANELARRIAGLTGGRAVITTATDTRGVLSLDLLAKEKGLAIANLDAVKFVNMALVSGEPIQVYDPEDRLGLENAGTVGLNMNRVEREDGWDIMEPGVWVTLRPETTDPAGNRLILHPKSLIAGIGCNRGTTANEILDLISRTFKDHSLTLKGLQCIATIEAKRDEQGLIDAAHELNVPLLFTDPSGIESIKVPNPSSMVKKHMGVSSVCEAAALLKSKGGRLLVPKTKSLNVTLAVALENY